MNFSNYTQEEINNLIAISKKLALDDAGNNASIQSFYIINLVKSIIRSISKRFLIRKWQKYARAAYPIMTDTEGNAYSGMKAIKNWLNHDAVSKAIASNNNFVVFSFSDEQCLIRFEEYLTGKKMRYTLDLEGDSLFIEKRVLRNKEWEIADFDYCEITSMEKEDRVMSLDDIIKNAKKAI